MRTSLSIPALAAVPISAPPAAQAADAVPKFDIARNCQAQITETGGTGEALASCIRDEEQARDDLAAHWGKFTSTDKSGCMDETTLAGAPSYTQLQTCLDVASYQKARLRPRQ